MAMDVAKLCEELGRDPLGKANSAAILVAKLEEMQEELTQVLETLLKFFVADGRLDALSTPEGGESHEIYRQWFPDAIKLFKQRLRRRLSSETEASVQVHSGILKRVTCLHVRSLFLKP